MKPYLEPRFLGILLLKTRRGPAAQTEIERFPAPYAISALAALEIEHVLYWGQQQEQHAPLRLASQRGQSEWDHHFAEGIFQLESPDWDNSFRLARLRMRQTQTLERSWSVYLHAALAVASGSSHYLSFESPFRRVAKAFGLRLLPERVH
jgi:hypothetical protein